VPGCDRIAEKAHGSRGPESIWKTSKERNIAMTKNTTLRTLLLICMVVTGLAVQAAAADAKSTAKAIRAGTGYSVLTDAAKAGAEAATKAKAALGKEAPKLVIVFAIPKLDQEKMLAGVTSVFDAPLVYGCSAYNAITQEGNAGTVGVLALGGHLRVRSTLAEVKEKDYQGCGTQIGKALAKAPQAKAAGKLLILLGDCHVSFNDKVVAGICGVLGEKFPVVGGAAAGGITYHKGKVVGRQKNIGLLIAGDFKLGISALKEGPTTVHKNKLVAAAGQAFKNAVGDGKKDLALMFAFDCGGRRGQMGKDRPDELKVMQAVIGKRTPLFGFYGSGEMGPKDNDSPPRGVGFHIVACAISTSPGK